MRRALGVLAICAAVALGPSGTIAGQAPASPLPPGELAFGAFKARFVPGSSTASTASGTFTLEGDGWPPFKGAWTAEAGQIELNVPGAPDGCSGPGRYRFTTDERRVSFDLVSDACEPRRMILDRSSWLPAGVARAIPVRRIERTTANRAPLAPAGDSRGSWPSFRGPQASGVADGQQLPDSWNGTTGENILWRTPIPGLAHSSPVVWGDRLFVTSAISSRAERDVQARALRRRRCLRRSLARSAGCSTRSTSAPARSSGSAWRTKASRATSGTSSPPTRAPRPPPTAASSSRGSDRRASTPTTSTAACAGRSISAASTWARTTSRRTSGGRPARRSSGTAWSSCSATRRPIRSCSRSNAETGETVWKTDRDELPSWGTPTVVDDAAGPRAGHQRVELHPRLRPDDRQGAVAARRQLEDHRADADLRRRPASSSPAAARPSGRSSPCGPARAAISRCAKGETQQRVHRLEQDRPRLVHADAARLQRASCTCSRTTACSMPTTSRPARRSIGSGCRSSAAASARRRSRPTARSTCRTKTARCSSSPPGATFKHIATNSMGELLMATPALSDGVMYVRSARSLFAIGRQR